jgi:ATP-dependent DNA helicase PIF1
LKVSYALSIHKSQGMTIDALEIDLGDNIFTCGQAYTALSRAKSLRNIRIIDVSKQSFKMNPSVKAFYTKCMNE